MDHANPLVSKLAWYTHTLLDKGPPHDMPIIEDNK